MENIIEPVDRAKILSELTDDKFLRMSNHGDNKIYVCDAHNSPNIMREIGRLREISFRTAGGGTGKSIDIDEADLWENPYKQLIVWNDEFQEIIGGYRYIDCSGPIKYTSAGQPELSSAEIFNFSSEFISQYLPYTIELGRSFVQPKFQSRENFKIAIYALDNLWDGLGAIYKDNMDHVKYFFGKVTMYTSFNAQARDHILGFINKYFQDKDNLVTPCGTVIPLHDSIMQQYSGTDYKSDYKLLNKNVRACDTNIPPLVNAYMNLASTMKVFGTAINPHFGGVEETGLLIAADDIYPEKKERHLDTYTSRARQ